MPDYAQPLHQLIEELKHIPGIGAKTAQRIAFHILGLPQEEAERLAEAVREVKKRIFHCSVCNNITHVDPCTMCTDGERSSETLCVVEEPYNISSIEKTGIYHGRYHVLLGTLAPLRGVGPDELRLDKLIRRVEGAEAFGLTFPLVMTSDGKKMGKTEKGALFLDPAICSPYDFFQYWRNVADSDVERFLLMFTFLPAAECRALGSARDAGINAAKERLAWEVTALIHGATEADSALAAAKAAFGGSGDIHQVPSKGLARSNLAAGMGVLDLFVYSGLVPSKSEARRLVQQGGAVVNERKVEDEKAVVDLSWLDTEGALMLRAGKKRVFRILAE